MSVFPPPPPRPHATFASEARRHRASLRRAFWIGTGGLITFILWKGHVQYASTACAAWFVAFACLLPSFLWCTGASTGLPIFPLFSLMQINTYVIPILTGQPQLRKYAEMQIVTGCLTVGVFLLISTLLWVRFSKETPFAGGTFRVLIEGRGLSVSFLPVLALDLLRVSESAGWIPANASWYTLARGATLGLSTLSLFVLGYRLGARDLGLGERVAFIAMLALAVVSSMTTLLLVGAMADLLVTLIGFLIGRGRAPWRAVLIWAAVFTFLHQGKGEMRIKYWPKEKGHLAVTPLEYPGFYTEWIVDALKHSGDQGSKAEDAQPIWWRGSLLHLLLMVQENTPSRVPYLHGATYGIIPELFVPRMFNKHKIRSHEGTYMLAVHYGLQSLKDTNTTTIGFGLLNEAFANYGYMGVLGLAIVIGSGFGWVTRWSQHAPLFAFRSLAAVVVLSYSLQSEFSAGVYVAALFQSIASLGVVSWLIMKEQYYPATEDLNDLDTDISEGDARADALA